MSSRKATSVLPDSVASAPVAAAAGPLFDETEYAELRTHYLEERMWSKELTDGISLRPRPKASRMDCEKGPGWKALRQRVATLEAENNHYEIFRLLSQLKQWEQLRGVFPSVPGGGGTTSDVQEVIDLTNAPDDDEVIDVESYIVDVLLVKIVKADPDSLPDENASVQPMPVMSSTLPDMGNCGPNPESSTLLPTQSPTTAQKKLVHADWQPVGQMLHGKASDYYFGDSVALSRDGSAMAVGADKISNPGYVVVHRHNPSNQQWIQIGQELVGQRHIGYYGYSVSLNGDGTILAVGAPSVGHVRVFEYYSALDRWVQLGSDILGHDARDQFGVSVSLSDAGDILAVGADLDDTENGYGSGSVRLFQYDRGSSSWNQLGQTLIGQARDDSFGSSVSLNAQGTIVGVGAHWNDSGGNNAGQVSVYEYNSASSKWDPLGDSINGQIVYGYFGYSVSLDDSGLIAAVGACGRKNERVLVYSYDRSTLTWNQRGQTLLTQQPGNYFGWSVSLSGNGNVLVVGSEDHDVNGMDRVVQVRNFQHDSNADEWKQVGDPLNGEAEYDDFGNSVSLSADGSVVGVGAPLPLTNNANCRRSGSAYAFTVNNN